MTEDHDDWCFAWVEEPPASTGADRAVALRRSLWTAGDTLTIAFLDGAKSLHERVRAVARRWVGPERANLRLTFQKKPEAMVRISFACRGSWSAVGTTCLQVTDAAKPTMNFGWLSAATEEKDLQRVVLHEFGHALGLIHEHQHPQGGIRWNREKVTAALSGPPHFWSAAQITRNIFEPATKKETNFTTFDPASIMLYPIPAAWTTDGFSSATNTELSAADVALVRRLYPWE